MYKDLEYQLGGSSDSLNDLMDFVNENKIIIFLVIAVLFMLKTNTKEGFITYENIKKNLFFWDSKTNDLTYNKDENQDDTN